MKESTGKEVIHHPFGDEDQQASRTAGIAAPGGSRGAQRTNAPVGDRLKPRKKGNDNEQV